MGRLPSDEFKIAETNNLLSRVPGMEFMGAVVKKTVGGQGGKVDPQTLQVEDTNAAVANIVGRGFIKEHLTVGRRELREDALDVLKQALADLQSAGELFKAKPDQDLLFQDVLADLDMLIKAAGE